MLSNAITTKTRDLMIQKRPTEAKSKSCNGIWYTPDSTVFRSRSPLTNKSSLSSLQRGYSTGEDLGIKNKMRSLPTSVRQRRKWKSKSSHCKNPLPWAITSAANPSWHCVRKAHHPNLSLTLQAQVRGFLQRPDLLFDNLSRIMLGNSSNPLVCTVDSVGTSLTVKTLENS